MKSKVNLWYKQDVISEKESTDMQNLSILFLHNYLQKWIEIIRILGEGLDPDSFSCSTTLTWGCQDVIWTSESANSSVWTNWMPITTLLWGGIHSDLGVWMHLVSAPLYSVWSRMVPCEVLPWKLIPSINEYFLFLWLLLCHGL